MGTSKYRHPWSFNMGYNADVKGRQSIAQFNGNIIYNKGIPFFNENQNKHVLLI
ncbi:hypothetical protein DSECCO2_160730 [anaerobic digester metagenome]